MNTEPTNIILPEPPANHVWQYRGMGATFKGICLYASSDEPEAHLDFEGADGHDIFHYWEAVAVNHQFKKGDKVRSKKTSKEYTIVDINPCKVEDSQLQVWSADLEHLELVVDAPDIPLIEQLRTELDAKAGIAEALENAIARADHERRINADNHERAVVDRDKWMKIADNRQLQINRLEGEVKNWTEAAAQQRDGARYYRDLLIRCGEAIGREAYTADDGSVSEDVLVAKVPELVKGLVNFKARAYAKDCLSPLGNKLWSAKEIVEESIAEPELQDFGCTPIRKFSEPITAFPPPEAECEKWLRAYAPEKLREAYEMKPPTGTNHIKSLGELMRHEAAVRAEAEWPEKPAPPEPDHTEGGKYRMLEEGEILQEGDTYLERNQWVEVKYCIGTPLVLAPEHFWRRPVKPEDIDPPDYAAEAKEHIQKMLNPHFEGGVRITGYDLLVDLIIKAAKQ